MPCSRLRPDPATATNCFAPESQQRTFDWFEHREPGRHSLHIVPGYGHNRMLEVEVAANAVYTWAAQQILARRLAEERPSDPSSTPPACTANPSAARVRAPGAHDLILDWPATPTDLRARGPGQLNKSVSANAMHHYVSFGGRVHARDPEQLQRDMDARRLISNVTVYWNTRYIAHALDTLERHGHTLRDDDIRRMHPVHFEHINPFGHYRFDTRRGSANGRLRPLRAAIYIPRANPATNSNGTAIVVVDSVGEMVDRLVTARLAATSASTATGSAATCL